MVLGVVHVKKTTPTMLGKIEETVFPESAQCSTKTVYQDPTQENIKTKDASSQTPEMRRSTRVLNGRKEDEIESDSDERDVILVRRREASSQTPERQSFITSSMQEERDEETEFGLVLIGQTGSGKSSVGNMIIGSDVFGRKVVNVLDTSYTQKIKCMDQKIGSKRFFVVDTPGIPVINKNTERQTVLQLIQSAKQEVQDTPYAFLLVVSLDKYLSPEFINFLQNRCDDIFDRLVVVFTCGNNQEIDDNSLLSSVSNELRKFIKNNNLQLIKLNCNYSKLDSHLDAYTKRKVTNLLHMCENIANSSQNCLSTDSRLQNLAVI
ncbi:unnamed protein product [Mytilus edulis]|uniref:AIG1-type G domain-containing protein n=1 Tax=Mytilus edulis TaxID=6550 RepID=A0A8S3T9Q1_MYTED|nr:unnamed protein product [Mytilus edulis]